MYYRKPALGYRDNVIRKREGALAGTLLAAVAFSACSRSADRAANDSGAPRDSLRADTTVAAPPFREWRAEAGRHLLIAGEAPDTALVIFPEFTADSSLDNIQFVLDGAQDTYELFAPNGAATLARLTRIDQGPSTGCDRWPAARVEPAGELRTWTVGFQANHARGITYTSVDQLPARDSTGIAVAVARLASQAPNDTVSALRGLPYVVRSAHVAQLSDSQMVVFGEAMRRVNVEANPFEERTIVIGERNLRAAEARFILGFSERHTGDEESVPTTELIGVVELRSRVVLSFLSREYSDGGVFLMLERQSAGTWRARWQSAYAGC